MSNVGSKLGSPTRNLHTSYYKPMTFESLRQPRLLVAIRRSDQWGNITSGIELLRREREVQGFGLDYAIDYKSRWNEIWENRRQCGFG